MLNRIVRTLLVAGAAVGLSATSCEMGTEPKEEQPIVHELTAVNGRPLPYPFAILENGDYFVWERGQLVLFNDSAVAQAVRTRYATDGTVISSSLDIHRYGMTPSGNTLRLSKGSSIIVVHVTADGPITIPVQPPFSWTFGR